MQDHIGLVIFLEIPSILTEWYIKSLRDIDINLYKIEQIKDLIKGVIDGLLFAYEQNGVIHRDIKPDNILLDKENKPKISDFGLSMLISDTANSTAGTLGYMAPELLLGFQPSISTDIYALGITLFETITNKKVYDFKSYEVCEKTS